MFFEVEIKNTKENGGKLPFKNFFTKINFNCLNIIIKCLKKNEFKLILIMTVKKFID